MVGRSVTAAPLATTADTQSSPCRRRDAYRVVQHDGGARRQHCRKFGQLPGSVHQPGRTTEHLEDVAQ
jgi:hypothetical protein